MPDRHELQFYDYVNQPYEAVRDAVLLDPVWLFQRATQTATRRSYAELRVHMGAIDITADVDIALIGVTASRSPRDQPATKLAIEWSAARRRSLFPTMRATLSIYALTPTETQLDFCGTYDPPLGVVGEAADALVMHRLARQSVEAFVQDLGAFLRSRVARVA